MSTASTPHQASSHTPLLPSITADLDRNGPRFDIDAKQVKVLAGPKEFYETLKGKLRGAKRRIYLATLYIGKAEHELMGCIEEALRKNPELKVSILTDALRGTRESPDPSCASLLADLAAKFPNQVEIRMYHTPNLTGLRKRFIPKRINEGWGLQHMKLYGVDDEVILSGANLSDDYFTNRQDRYHVFTSGAVTDYFGKVHETMCSSSFLVKPDMSPQGYYLTWPSENVCVSPLEDPKVFIESTKTMFNSLIMSPEMSRPATTNTSLYPMLIIPHAVNTELPIITRLVAHRFPPQANWLFTAGYFNPHPQITASLLGASAAGTTGVVVTASPWANGFYGSKGVSGMLPAAYTLLSRRFLKAVNQQAPGNVGLREWRLGTVGRPHGWTYHAKGLWLNLGKPVLGEKEVSAPTTDAASIKLTGTENRGDSLKRIEDGDTGKASNGAGLEATITLIGSSNYTVRSYSLDTEVGAVIATTDPTLRKQLQQEQQNLLQHTKGIGLQDLSGGERKVGLGVRLAMWIVTAVGGSL
jgi:CDP-diacylglycerol--glycerol-3-phosphate 3-phosphatidyltransferase